MSVYDTSEVDKIFGNDQPSTPTREEEVATRTPSTGYFQRLEDIKRVIDFNMEYIYNFVDSLKESDQVTYQQYLQEYTNLYNWYNATIEAAYVSGEEALTDSEKEQYINEMRQINEYVLSAVNNIAAQGHPPPREQSIEDEGTVPSTSMVQHDDEIVMENVGPIRAWWENRSPNQKLIMKAAVLGGLFFGGKKIYDKYIGGK